MAEVPHLRVRIMDPNLLDVFRYIYNYSPFLFFFPSSHSLIVYVTLNSHWNHWHYTLFDQNCQLMRPLLSSLHLDSNFTDQNCQLMLPVLPLSSSQFIHTQTVTVSYLPSKQCDQIKLQGHGKIAESLAQWDIRAAAELCGVCGS